MAAYAIRIVGEKRPEAKDNGLTHARKSWENPLVTAFGHTGVAKMGHVLLMAQPLGRARICVFQTIQPIAIRQRRERTAEK